LNRRAVLVVITLVLLAGIGYWLYANASLPRLRAEFLPWMERLGSWRDGIESSARALRSREPTGTDPSGIGPLRDWAWGGLDRIAFVSYRVEKPSHEISEVRDRTSGRARFTVGGFRPDGARVERSADATLVVDLRPGLNVFVRLEKPVGERDEAFPRFRNGTQAAGFGASRQDPPFQLKNWLIADIWPGSGVAVLDFDRDGDEDLFVGDGARSLLYQNDGAGRFADVTQRAALEGVAATGVAAGDVDGDGYPDLLVTDSFGPARLFRNRGDGSFEETTQGSGIVVPRNARTAAFADVDRDGDLDLFVCVTGDYYKQMPDPPYDANDAAPNRFFLNDGKGRFRDATAEWGLAAESRWSLSCLFADFDADGFADLLVTNDFGLKNLYRNDHGSRFVDVTKETRTGVRAYGMSGAWADFDGDGRLDLYTTGTDTQWYFVHEYPAMPVPLAGRLFLPIAISWMEKMSTGNSLLLQREPGRFHDATDGSGARHAGWNWTAAAADLDNDSWPDLYAANGMWGDGRDRDRELEFWWETLAYWNDYIEGKKTFDRKGAGIAGIERDRYFRNRRGKASDGPLFEERAFLDGLDLETNGRAAIAFDANDDGALDLYVRSVQAPEALFLGTRRSGERFLRLRLRGAPGKSPRDGTGARVMAVLPGGRTVVLETGNSSGYLSTGSPVAHLGLGEASRVTDLTVRWPSGRLQRLGPIEHVDRTLLVDEEHGIAGPR
jgi:hypothetical protein